VELIEDRFQFIGVDAGFGGGGHEIGVGGPAGDDVDVEVLRDPSAGTFADVDSDIESVGGEFFFQGFSNLLDEFPEVGGFLIGEFPQVFDGAVGDDERMPGIVRIAVEDGEGGLGTGKDSIFPVIGRLAEGGEEFVSIFRWRGHITVAPGGPKVFHGSTMS
jgi:hypothetical protein